MAKKQYYGERTKIIGVSIPETKESEIRKKIDFILKPYRVDYVPEESNHIDWGNLLDEERKIYEHVEKVFNDHENKIDNALIESLTNSCCDHCDKHPNQPCPTLGANDFGEEGKDYKIIKSLPSGFKPVRNKKNLYFTKDSFIVSFWNIPIREYTDQALAEKYWKSQCIKG